jgi:hypothetical protein
MLFILPNSNVLSTAQSTKPQVFYQNARKQAKNGIKIFEKADFF